LPDYVRQTEDKVFKRYFFLMRRCAVRKSVIASLLPFVVASLSSLAGAEDIYYVQSLKAKILSKPSFRSKVIGESSRGSKLVTIGRKGRWIKILLNRQIEGYVSSLLVSKHPPMSRQRVIKGDAKEIRQNVRRRASTYTSAAAARGLAQDDRRRLSAEDKLDYGGLEKMESITVSSEEVMRFIEGNRI
jgi:uncharacterized protein YgiM (DUF1202 family)